MSPLWKLPATLWIEAPTEEERDRLASALEDSDGPLDSDTTQLSFEEPPGWELVQKHSESEIYDSQDKWIRENLSDEAADSANIGWAVDEVLGQVSTKIYGEHAGVLTTSMETGEHEYEER